MARPVGLSAGVVGLILAWLGGVSIVRLTGAAPVMLVLSAGVVLLVAAVVSSLVTVLRVHVGLVELAPVSTVGDHVPMRAAITAPRPVWVDVAVGDDVVASGWAIDGRFAEPVTMRRRGIVDRVELRIRTAGPLGLVWWGRRLRVPIADHLVAPRPTHGDAVVETRDVGRTGELAGRPGASAGEIDGVRSWRDGDSEHAVHWPSTWRSGELVVRDRLHDAGGVWVVRARPDGDDPEAEAGRVRRRLEDGLRRGAQVYAAVGDGQPLPMADEAAIERWTATVDLGGESVVPLPWWQRPVRLGRRIEPEATATLSARWWTAAATWTGLAMLLGALEYSSLVLAATTAGIVAGAAVSGRSLVSGEPPAPSVRVLTSVGALVALAFVVAAAGRLDGILAFLRGPLPQILLILIVLHGFECRDRRTIRVAIAISGVVVMYAAGFRVDDRVGWWIAGWVICFAVAVSKLGRPTRLERPETPAPERVLVETRRWAGRVVAGAAGAVASVALLVVVPVPDGPARLTLPTFLDEDAASPLPSPGAIAGPDGRVTDSAPPLPESTPARGPAGVAGGYTGFAETMDTSVRGRLGDQVVMRVRAPAPDYWRGQTFGRFDGRTWYADDATGDLRDGPNIDVRPALGDLPVPPHIEVEEFVQTFYLETDMPNLVFHAYRPARVILDADVWARPDGALRASTVLPEGSVYTVVSARPRVDPTILRAQGDVGARLNDFGRQVLAPYLEIPASTSRETAALADELAAGMPSTYDVVQSYVAWMQANVEYDLDAPLPDAGEDAVHDFLFDSRVGFCEQIASALAIMLRTQGVPARLATGYLPGDRDRVAGVFAVRARDAHAWVEVWFPESGWQAFDPTASVPLSADADIDSLGGDLAQGARRYVDRNGVWVAAALVTLAVAAGIWQLTTVLRYRRRRGRWGLLQDRFVRVGERRGVPDGTTNTRRARWWPEPTGAAARTVAERLDRAAFDPTFTDDDELYEQTRELVGSLGGARPRR